MLLGVVGLGSLLTALVVDDWGVERPRYGIDPKHHARKVHPWVVRLDAATAGLEEAVAAGHRRDAVRELEDVQFWLGRITCDLLSAMDIPGNEPLAMEVAQSAARAQAAVHRARQLLGG